jgi:hypothetical protein
LKEQGVQFVAALGEQGEQPPGFFSARKASQRLFGFGDFARAGSHILFQP